MRILPAGMIIHLLSFIDRSNIGNAKVLDREQGDSLVQTLQISNEQYLLALMIFIVAFTIIQTPSNYMLKKCGPSRWMALMMFCWGAMTMLLAAVKNFSGLVAVRFFLGAFESGLFPGLVYVITFWYRPEERAVRIALIVACSSLGGAFGGAIAFGIGKHLNMVRGLEAWRWLFLIEGAPSCLAAILCALFFPDYPETEAWLSDGERELATQRIKGVASLGHEKITWPETKATLMDWRLYGHYIAYISNSVSFSSNSLFAPTIVAGLGYTGLDAQLFTVPPYAIGFVVTVLVSWIADRYEVRSLATFFSMLLAGVSYVVQGALPPDAFVTRYVFLCIALSFSFACNPTSMSWLTANLRSTGAATLAIPLCVAFGQLGQIIGVYIYKDSEAPGFPTGHFTNAGFLIEGAILIMSLRLFYVYKNKRLASGERQWRL
ncbi:MFS transporter [Dichomitus squalens LYAD-421 SS1]|uniref:MFS transporter n=2 Tax=Dichomitus squalens TaxID=114155 RepID=A0A4Q9MA75_9APHY|nr:MFS transporter [Dichomitus squalens LYAD-421 SS1]EJF62070.1 MFS transporter [Dichomitus squalens LYAD-421 SS1]TBU23387.1 MFS transporter [Dichomitus squalens]TBU60260.1 MFS transporter [Dichomitus squalens]